MHLLSFGYFGILISGVCGLSPRYLECQLQKQTSSSQLTGCPPGTIYVSRTDPAANYASVQAAVSSLSVCLTLISEQSTVSHIIRRPEKGHATILIGAGEYNEAVNVSRTGPLTLLGQIKADTSLDSRENATATNLVYIWNNTYVANSIFDDAQTAVLTVAPSFNASLIGSGPTGPPLQPLFGNVDFKAYNINFENRAANYSISQALVTDISYANASFYGCSFASYQDTWYTGRNGSTYVVDSIIFGETDYLFGFGTSWFQNVVLANRGCGGGIVAWKGTNQTGALPYLTGNRYGAYISDSKIVRSPDANPTTVTTGKCYLGRPWNDLATTVYLRTYMDDSVNVTGWTPFDSARPVILNTTYYAEYHSYGPGGNTSERISLEHILTPYEAHNFTLDAVFLEHPHWIDYDYQY